MTEWEKIYKKGDHSAVISYVDTSAEFIEAMQGLAKTALKAAAKVIRKQIKNNLPERTGRIKNHVGSWAHIKKDTGQPELQIGFYSAQGTRKRHKQPSHANPWWIEQRMDSLSIAVKPHLITAKKTKFLGNNGHFFPHTVMHPGIPARHTLRDTITDNLGEIQAAEEKYLKELNNSLEHALKKIDTDETDEYD